MTKPSHADRLAMAQRYAAAWSSGDPRAVASFFEADGRVVINNGEPIVGHAALAEMAAGFHAEFPDLVIKLDDFRCSAENAVFAWTLEGKHAQTGNFVRVGGWEQWILTEANTIAQSRGYFDADEYDRQIAEGI